VSYKRYLVAGAIAIAGVGAAWPFRHPLGTSTRQTAPKNEVAAINWGLPHDVTLQVHPQSGISPAPELAPSVSSPAQVARPASFNKGSESEQSLEAFPAPPFLPMAYESLLVPVSSSPRPAAPATSPVQEPLLPSVDDPVTPDQVKPGPLWRKHRIVEGDTLAVLAQRYLGDASRAGEIHVANLDRLASPEILPLGVTLLIPPRVASGTDR
jgi:hypothetical protein